MTPINEQRSIQKWKNLVRELDSPGSGSFEISLDWVKTHGWQAAAVESMARLPSPEIPRIVAALRAGGHEDCIAVATEPLGDIPACYQLTISEEDFFEVNRRLGPFRFALTNEARSWVISCNEWYNVFAGPQPLVEAMLGKSLQQAKDEFLRFANSLAQGPHEPLVVVAERYGRM